MLEENGPLILLPWLFELSAIKLFILSVNDTSSTYKVLIPPAEPSDFYWLDELGIE